MRTQIMHDPNAQCPWLDYYHVGESHPRRCELLELPFTIGRDESADFQVDSNRVSRKHVTIDRSESSYVIQDLGSTNGTYLNGKRIEEAELTDGDVLVIADFEMTFFSGHRVAEGSATQIMSQPAGTQTSEFRDLILQVRRMHETLTHRSVSNQFQPIVRLEDRTTFGYQAIRDATDLPSPNRHTESLVQNTECRLTWRVNQQHRLVAAEQATALPEPTHLFFALQVSEVNADFLPDSLGQLRSIGKERHQLVAEIPDTAVCDIPYFRQFLEALRQHGIEVAYSGFCGGPAQISGWANVAPDYIKLAPTMVNGISRASGGWRKVEMLTQAARELDSPIIALGVDELSDAECLAELGCQFAQGDHFGKPQLISAFVDQLLAAGNCP